MLHRKTKTFVDLLPLVPSEQANDFTDGLGRFYHYHYSLLYHYMENNIPESVIDEFDGQVEDLGTTYHECCPLYVIEYMETLVKLRVKHNLYWLDPIIQEMIAHFKRVDEWI